MTTSFIVLEENATGLKVTKLQAALKQLNFYFGAVDGVFGAKTKAALIKFQQPYSHLPSNGIVDAETILQLDEDVWLSGKEVLREGSTGDEVKALQEMFSAYDLQTLTADGYFGRKTKDAVIWFQQNWSLTADGIVGKQTWAALYRHQVHDVPYEDRVDAFFGKLNTDTFIKLPLNKGDRGRDVLVLQKFLNYVSGSASGILEDGDFGSVTEQTVKHFQQSNGLTVDGCVGMKTYQAMISQGLNQQLIDQILSYRYGKLLNFTQGKEYEVVEDAVVRGESVIYRFDVEPAQNFRIEITSLENNAVFELFGYGDGNTYVQEATDCQVFLEAGKYYINVGGTRGNATYKLKVESIIGC
ncbi:MAG: peptidoglycan-binding protein [Cyanobacteria bacterium P01_C01_bin.38]